MHTTRWRSVAITALATTGLSLGLAAGCSWSGADQAASSGSGGEASQTASSSASSGTAAGGGGGSAASTQISLPQFVHGAARVDTTMFAQIPLVVAFTGAAPDAVDVDVGGSTLHAALDGQRFVATVDTTTLAAGSNDVAVRATIAGREVASATGALSASAASLQFTTFAEVGPAYAGHLEHDAANDSIDVSWVSVAGGKHGMWLAALDGAFARIQPTDLSIGDPADEPLDGHTAFGGDDIGVVYRTAKPNDGHWLVKLRVVDHQGAEVVPTIDLTQGEAAFTPTQAGADAGGFSAAWLHISPAPDPNNPPPVEVRFARWDLAAGALVGPVTIDMDQPAPAASMQGPQTIEPLTELGIACNDRVCVVTYTRDVYIPLVDLNVPKLFVAVVDLATGALAGAPTAVEATDWDTQLFGHHVIALADGSFELVYEANDTSAAVTPKSPCDESLERDLLFLVKLDATGALMGAPAPIFDFQGTREYPRIAPHEAGFAMFWEDQRSECGPDGHIRMATSVVAPDGSGLVDPYLELPDSVGLPPEDPTLAVTSTNFAVAWSDDRHGGGLLDSKPELFLDTYWR